MCDYCKNREPQKTIKPSRPFTKKVYEVKEREYVTNF